MEEKKPKKISLSIYIMILAVVLIAAGSFMLVTGDKKSLSDDGKDNDVVDNQKKNMDIGLTTDEALAILTDKYSNEFGEADWSIGKVLSVTLGNENTYLVNFERISAEGLYEEYQTVIIAENGASTVIELPGWHVGERDLTEYGFNSLEQANEPTINEPVEVPAEVPAEVPVEETPVVEENVVVEEQTAE